MCLNNIKIERVDLTQFSENVKKMPNKDLKCRQMEEDCSKMFHIKELK